MSKNVTIYTSNTCAYCNMVKQYLQLKGHTYDEINIEQDPAKRQELVAISGQMNVPVTVVTQHDGRQDVSVGYNLGQLASALN